MARILGALAIAFPGWAAASTAPAWMHARAGLPVPAYDDRTDAVLLYAETVLTVQPDGRMRRLDRRAYRILRPGGESFGMPQVGFDSQSRIIAMRGWCIPVSGDDYEVTERNAIETGDPDLQRGTLAGDVRFKVLRIPAATPGSIVGYEYEKELWPYQLADTWVFQEQVPVREWHYTLSLPPGWTYKLVWLNHQAQAGTAGARNQWTWVVRDVAAIRKEPHMPPWTGIVGQVMVEPIAPNAQGGSLDSWRAVGNWYLNLARDRRDASPELRQKVAELTAPEPTVLGKIRALARFVQREVRYVAIELGIGGFQPRGAAAVLANRYGDCKDKATLLSSMLAQIGIDSHYVLINTERGSIGDATPPSLSFNHVILAIQLPKEIQDPSLLARFAQPAQDGLLIFDPTDELTPFGQLRGPLQSNYGLLVMPDGGTLAALPQLPAGANAVRRFARLTLDARGVLRGDVREIRVGDPAGLQRYVLRNLVHDTDQIRPVEAAVADSFATVNIVKASAANLNDEDRPFEWTYTLEAADYAKLVGDLLLVRPRVLGSDAKDFLEIGEARMQAIEFERPEQDTDLFEITLPGGYAIEELPPPVNVDYGFASYHSQSEVSGQTLRYTRSLEIRELSVPAARAGDLKELYRTIRNDERSLAVLKRATR